MKPRWCNFEYPSESVYARVFHLVTDREAERVPARGTKASVVVWVLWVRCRIAGCCGGGGVVVCVGGCGSVCVPRDMVGLERSVGSGWQGEWSALLFEGVFDFLNAVAGESKRLTSGTVGAVNPGSSSAPTASILSICLRTS